MMARSIGKTITRIFTCLLLLMAAIVIAGTDKALAADETMQYGDTMRFECSFNSPDITEVTWSTSDEKVCKAGEITDKTPINYLGMLVSYRETCEVSAVGLGKCTVFAQCGNDIVWWTVVVTKRKVEIPEGAETWCDGKSHWAVGDDAEDNETSLAIKKGLGYTLSGECREKHANLYTCTASLVDSEHCEWADGTIDDKEIDWEIGKGSQWPQVSGNNWIRMKASRLKKKSISYRAYKLKGAKGKLSYKKLHGSSKMKINVKTGKITVKKGTKKGTYRAMVQVRAAGNSDYEPFEIAMSFEVNVV